MVDARKWYASKFAPKKYGEKIDAALPGPDGGPIQEQLTVEWARTRGKTCSRMSPRTKLQEPHATNRPHATAQSCVAGKAELKWPLR